MDSVVVELVVLGLVELVVVELVVLGRVLDSVVVELLVVELVVGRIVDEVVLEVEPVELRLVSLSLSLDDVLLVEPVDVALLLVVEPVELALDDVSSSSVSVSELLVRVVVQSFLAGLTSAARAPWSSHLSDGPLLANAEPTPPTAAKVPTMGTATAVEISRWAIVFFVSRMLWSSFPPYLPCLLCLLCLPCLLCLLVLCPLPCWELVVVLTVLVELLAEPVMLVMLVELPMLVMLVELPMLVESVAVELVMDVDEVDRLHSALRVCVWFLSPHPLPGKEPPLANAGPTPPTAAKTPTIGAATAAERARWARVFRV